MKRRFLLLGVLSFLTLSSCNLIPGLGPTGKSSSSSPSSNSPSSQSNSGSKSSSKSTTTTTEEHEHTFSEEWSSDDTYHWHAATCGHNVRKDYEKHTWVSEMAPVDEWDSKGTLKNTCSVCQRTAYSTSGDSSYIKTYKNLDDGTKRLTFTATKSAVISYWYYDTDTNVSEIVFGENIVGIREFYIWSEQLTIVTFSSDIKAIKNFSISGDGEKFQGFYFYGDRPEYIDIHSQSFIYYDPTTKGWDDFAICGCLVRPNDYVRPETPEITLSQYATLMVDAVNERIEKLVYQIDKKGEEDLFLMPTVIDDEQIAEMADAAKEIVGSGTNTDISKADDIYNWITTNITGNGWNSNLYNAFKNKSANNEQRANLMIELLKHVGVMAFLVKAYDATGANTANSLNLILTNSPRNNNYSMRYLVAVYASDATSKVRYYDPYNKVNYQADYTALANTSYLMLINNAVVIPEGFVFDNYYYDNDTFFWIGDELYCTFRGKLTNYYESVNSYFDSRFRCDNDTNNNHVPTYAIVRSNILIRDENDFSDASYSRADGYTISLLSLIKWLSKKNKMSFIQNALSNYKDMTINVSNNFVYCNDAIVSYIGNSSSVVVPSKIDGTTITTVCRNTFVWNDTIQYVDFEEGIKYIEGNTFACCENLDSVLIPKTVVGPDPERNISSSIYKNDEYNSVEYRITYYCPNFTGFIVDSNNTKFKDVGGILCTKDGIMLEIPQTFTSVSFDNVSYIANGAALFSKLTSVNIPSNIKSIGLNAFEECASLKEVTFTGFTTTSKIAILNYAFYDCPLIKEFAFPEGTKYISSNVLSNCYSLVDVTLPSTTLSIYNYAFSGSGICHINIPNKVKTIEEYAFNDCPRLYDIDNHSTNISEDAWNNIIAYNEDYIKDRSATNYTYIDDNGFVFYRGATNYLLAYVGEVNSDTLHLPANCQGSAYTVADYFFKEGSRNGYGYYNYNKTYFIELYTELHNVNTLEIPSTATYNKGGTKGIPNRVNIVIY